MHLAADVAASLDRAEEVEQHNARNRNLHVLKTGPVVAQPVKALPLAAREGAPRDYKRQFVSQFVGQGSMGKLHVQKAIQVVHVLVEVVPIVQHVRGQRFVG